jgi:hypothetical protein
VIRKLLRALLPIFSIARELSRLNRNIESYLAHLGVQPLPDTKSQTRWRKHDKEEPPEILEMDDELAAYNEWRRENGYPEVSSRREMDV